MTTSNQTRAVDCDPTALQYVPPEGFVLCSPLETLGKNCHWTYHRLEIDGGWDRGVIRSTTRKAGLNYVVQWQGESKYRHQLLALDTYGMSCDAPLYSWCVVAPAQVDWSAGGPKKKRRTQARGANV